MGTTAAAAKQGVRDAVVAALAGEAEVLVTWGSPGAWAAPDSVLVGDVSTSRAQSRGGPNRTVDEVHDVTIHVSSVTATASPEGQEACTRRALALLDLIDVQVRTAPGQALTPTAAAAGVFLAYVGAYTITETSPDDEAALQRGRSALVTATVTVQSRRT